MFFCDSLAEFVWIEKVSEASPEAFRKTGTLSERIPPKIVLNLLVCQLVVLATFSGIRQAYRWLDHISSAKCAERRCTERSFCRK